MKNFELMVSKMSAKKPLTVIITGDVNCRSSQWWENDIDNEECKIFEPFTSDLGLHQLISEPTHIMGDSKSCIDVIFTNQLNLFLESGIHPSLHEQCHHQIVFGELSIRHLTPPPYRRRIWFYDCADVLAIRKSIQMFRWREIIGGLTCPNKQVEMLTESLLNIFSIFIPNEVTTVKPRQAPWVTKSIKNFIRKKNRAYKNFVRSGQPNDKKEAINDMISRGSKQIEDAKDRYFKKIGTKLSSPETGIKKYWSLINKLLNKDKIPIIPPLLENDIFVLDFTEKAEIFNEYFIQQCTAIDSGSKIPENITPSTPPLTEFTISDQKVIFIIHSLNPNKANGWDDISIRMIKLCDDALLLPLKLIFENCLSQGIFPEMWKKANVVPVHKKNLKNLKQNYRPISLLPIFGKILES